jgi:hypothetical protein
MPKIFRTNQIPLNFFWEIILVILCRTMSAGSSNPRVRQRIEEGIAASKPELLIGQPFQRGMWLELMS